MKITTMPKANVQAPTSTPVHVIKAKTLQTPSTPLVEADPAAVEAVSEENPGLNTPATEAAPESEATKLTSQQHVELARKERRLVKLQQDIKAQQDALKSEQGKYISIEDLKADPYKYLNNAGVTYEQLTQQPAAQTPQDTLQAKIDALEAKLSSFDTKQTEKEKSEYQQALSVISGDVDLLVGSDERFETIKATGSNQEVVKLIEKVFEAEGTILSVEDAAQMVEKHLEEQTLNQIQKLSKLKKMQAKLAPQAAPLDEKPLQGKAPTKTLTNAMGVARPLSARERAILAFNRQLK